MHRVDFRSSRRARADSFGGGGTASSSSTTTTRRRRSLSFHRRRVSSSSNSGNKEDNDDDDWCHKPNPNSRGSQLRHLKNIPLQHKRASLCSSNRPPLAKIDEQYDETNSIAQESSNYNNSHQGSFPLVIETHHTRSPKIEPTRSNSSKTRMDSVCVGEQDGEEVLLVQVPNEEAVETVSLCLDGDDQHSDHDKRQQRQPPPPEEPMFLKFMRELHHKNHCDDSSMDTASVMDPVGDKYSIQLFEESSQAGFDFESLSTTTPLTGAPPPPVIHRTSISDISAFAIKDVLVPNNRAQSKKLYISHSPASVLKNMSHYQRGNGVGDGRYIQSESIRQEDYDDDESHYYDENQSTADSYSQATGSTVAFSQASTVAHQNSNNYFAIHTGKQDRSSASDRRIFMMDDAMSVDIDVLNYVEDKYAALALPHSSSSASAFYSDDTDASSVSSGMLTRSWQSGLTSVMTGLDKPVNISVRDEFNDMAKEVSKNPVAFTKWLNPL